MIATEDQRLRRRVARQHARARSNPLAAEHELVAVVAVLRAHGGSIAPKVGTLAWWAQRLAEHEIDRLGAHRPADAGAAQGIRRRVERYQRFIETAGRRRMPGAPQSPARAWVKSILLRAQDPEFCLIEGCGTAGWSLAPWVYGLWPSDLR